MDSEEALLLAWREGDQTAGDELLGRCFEPLFRFFRGKVNTGVDDLIQETLLACVESRDAIREGSSFRGFLFAVARHRLYDALRKDQQREQIDFSNVTLRDLGTSPSSAFARDERRQKLAMALQSIPVDAQIAIELAYWEHMKGPEIAQALDIPANTVRSRLARARRALERRLAELGLPALDPDPRVEGDDDDAPPEQE